MFVSMGQGCAAQAGLTCLAPVWYNYGMEQDKPIEKSMTFRLPVALMERLRVLAHRNHRPLVGELLVAIETHLAQEERKGKRD